MTGMPVAYCYKTFDLMHPNSKFILTVRDMESWRVSVKHDFTNNRANLCMKKIRSLVYGSTMWNDSLFVSAYIAHITSVLEYFKHRKKDLLVMNIIAGDGWNRLCPFLSKIIPREDFPHYNAREISSRIIVKTSN